MDAPPAVLVVGDLHHALGYEARLRKLADGLPVTFLPRLDDKAALMGLLQHCRVFVFPSTVEAMSMMLLEALALGAVGIAGDIPENTSILPLEYVEPQSLGEEVRSQLLIRYVLACLPEDGAQGAGIELLVARNRQSLFLSARADAPKLDVTACLSMNDETEAFQDTNHRGP